MNHEHKTPRILLIYTGGTIGMVRDEVTGCLRPFDFENILNNLPEVRSVRCHLDTFAFEKLLDSSNISPANWVEIATVVRERYERYDGFVVLHGTDTMAYTTSALSFMLSGLSKPVIFTGSQLPIGHLRTDAKENLITSLELASLTGEDGMPVIREVCLYFQHELYRGNRCTKVNAEQFSAFASPNYPALAHSGVHLTVEKDLLLPRSYASFSLDTHLETEILILHVFPGISPQMVRYLLDYSQLKGVILLTFGSGNAPDTPGFLSAVKSVIARNIPVVNITQCTKGAVNQGDYQVSRSLVEAGVISGRDMTREAALAKMMHLLGHHYSMEEIRRYMQKNLRGEVSEGV